MNVKRYDVQAKRKDKKETWTEWNSVDNYHCAEKHAAHVEELGYRSRIVVNDKQIKELWSILGEKENCSVTELTDAILDAGFLKEIFGTWKPHQSRFDTKQTGWACSVCCSVTFDLIDGKTAYCPDCGAKMKGGE